jgi:hypothetical protein
MGRIKTRPTGADVVAFLESVPNGRRRADGRALLALMHGVTGAPATMWGPSLVGFGSQLHTNTTGTNEWFVVGFSPRQRALTIYGVHDGDGPPDPLLSALGPHTTGKACLYIKQLSDIDEHVLEQMVRNAWERATRPT